MAQWSLVSEYIALVIITILGLCIYDRYEDSLHSKDSLRSLYWNGLILSALSILLNILSTYALFSSNPAPIWVDVLLNSAYFLVSVLMSAAIAYYMFVKIYEFVYDRTHFRIMSFALLAIVIVETVLIIVNIGTGILFSIEAVGEYTRGPLNWAGFAATILESFLVIIAYTAHHNNAGHEMKRIVVIAAPVVVLLLAFQMIFPDELMNGMLAAIINLIIFLNFQSVRVELDPLTGVPNRQALTSELDFRIAGGQQNQLILVALRNFTLINEALGHDGGDVVLRKVANALRELAKSGKVFRYNSVEFLLLFPPAGEIERDKRLQDVMECMQRNWIPDDCRAPFDFCVAELYYGGESWSAERVVRYLEYTVALAKKENRKLVQFDEDVLSGYKRREEILSLMNDALENNWFETWFQPMYNRTTQRFDAAEALMRLRDANGNMVSPNDFIPLAEQNGMVSELFWIALEDICKTLSSGKVPELKTVSINMTIRQFSQRNLSVRILETLDRYDLPYSCLKIEITERIFSEDIELVREVMEELLDAGIRFMVDDFGTGYSNLSAVLDLPFESIKLDRSLMINVADDIRSRLTVETMTSFFKKMGKTVVAEGIESAEQVECVLGYGVDLIQGFYYARPMDCKRLIAWYTTHSDNDLLYIDSNLL